MDASFIPVEVVPSKTPFGLDSLRRSYKSALSATAAIAAAPAVGTADETFPNMFLMPVSTPESAESATRIDLVYMGCLAGAAGSPVLPAQKHDESNAVQSASSSKLNTGDTLDSPATLQYYAPSSVLTYFSFGAAGTTEAPNPTASPVPITLTISDTTYSSGGGIQSTIDGLFVLQIISTIESSEIVPGHYWQNVARKSKMYSPWIFDVISGPYISMYSPGNGYAAGNTLTISAADGTATIHVLSVGSVWGGGAGILSFTFSGATFTLNHNAWLPRGAAAGAGRPFNVWVIP